MRKGFSLIEISIVLVIIGILIGGVLVGQTLLGTSKVQAIISDIQGYKEASSGFFEKYSYSAGDFPDADDYWTGTTAGNGDGTLGDPSSSAVEYWYFWHHLAQADFIKGNYTGAAGSVPKAAIDRSYISHFYDSGTASGGYYEAFYLTGAALPAETADVGATHIITGQDAYAIDKKIDDGIAGDSVDAIPDYGNGGTGGTVQGAGDCITGAAYELTTDDLCSLAFYYKY